MELRMKTKLEIIDETVAYYFENPNTTRAITEEGGYSYCNSQGKMCAVGRCLIDAQTFSQQYNCYFSNVAERVDNDAELQLYFKEEYQGHEPEFWSDIQTIHDLDSNWNIVGLSELGLDRVNKFKLKYSDIKD